MFRDVGVLHQCKLLCKSAFLVEFKESNSGGEDLLDVARCPKPAAATRALVAVSPASSFYKECNSSDSDPTSTAVHTLILKSTRVTMPRMVAHKTDDQQPHWTSGRDKVQPRSTTLRTA